MSQASTHFQMEIGYVTNRVDLIADFQTHVSQLFETPQKLWQWQFSVYFHTRKENMITKSYFTVIIMIIG
jgi:hypothetical protein